MECCPNQTELWLALAKLETYENAKKVRAGTGPGMEEQSQIGRVGQNVIIILGVIYNVTVYNVIYLGPPPLSLFVIQRYTNYITLYNVI